METDMTTQMETEEVSQSLPEALVEKIIAMMPFPFIFKARCLSKSWRSKLSSISSSEGSEDSLAAAAFQKQVGEWSNNWKTFSPVLISTGVFIAYDRASQSPSTEDFIAYDRASQSWPRLPSLVGFMPATSFFPGLTRLIVGALLYGFRREETNSYDMENITVVNILTRSWRQLPPRPNALVTTVLCHKLVIYPSLEMYKVILICGKDGCPEDYCAQIYDSKSNTWRSKAIRISSGFSEDPHVAASLNGVIYMVGVKTPHSLLAFNVEEETLEELRLSFNNNETLETATLNLVICNVNCLILVTKGRFYEGVYHDTVQVFKIDLGSRQLLRLAQGPPAALNLGTMPFLPPVGDGNCINFLKIDEDGRRVVAYNVDEDEWSCAPVPAPRNTYQWFGSSFQPGLSPFMAV